MYLVTWIEGEEVNYRIVEKKELSILTNMIEAHLIIQEIAA